MSLVKKGLPRFGIGTQYHAAATGVRCVPVSHEGDAVLVISEVIRAGTVRLLLSNLHQGR